MSNTSRLRREKVESSIPNWVVFSLFFITTIIIVSIVKAYLPLLVTGVAMLFVWTQLTKEKADIQTKGIYENDNQLSLFHKRNKIGKKYSNRQPLPTEPSGQRRRYLKTISEDDKMAA